MCIWCNDLRYITCRRVARNLTTVWLGLWAFGAMTSANRMEELHQERKFLEPYKKVCTVIVRCHILPTCLQICLSLSESGNVTRELPVAKPWSVEDLEILVPYTISSHILYDVVKAKTGQSILVLPPIGKRSCQVL